MSTRKDINSLPSNEKINNLIKFRNTTHIFYFFSFACFLVFYIMYLVSNKKISSCTYGSTLFCNNETKYPIILNSSQLILNEIKFKNNSPGTGSSTLIAYPYRGTSNYNINYFFGTTGGTDYGNGIGVSYQTDGASIYFNPIPGNLSSSLVNWTKTILENKVGEFLIVNSLASSNQGAFEYRYKTNQSSIKPIIPSNNKISGTPTQPSPTDNDSVNGNWVNLLKRNQIQSEKGCSSGTSAGCAVPDPSYVSNKLCSNFVQNPTTGFYCPPDNLNCELCTSTTIEPYNNCGFAFCNPSNDTISSNDFRNNTYGFYQNSLIPKQKPGEYTYKVGVNGPELSDVLGVGQEEFPNYNLQSNNFAAGSEPHLNNYDNQATDSNKAADITDQNQSNFLVNAKFGQWSEDKGFDF